MEAPGKVVGGGGTEAYVEMGGGCEEEKLSRYAGCTKREPEGVQELSAGR
jgi:hypothetical protein